VVPPRPRQPRGQPGCGLTTDARHVVALTSTSTERSTATKFGCPELYVGTSHAAGDHETLRPGFSHRVKASARALLSGTIRPSIIVRRRTSWNPHSLWIAPVAGDRPPPCPATTAAARPETKGSASQPNPRDRLGHARRRRQPGRRAVARRDRRALACRLTDQRSARAERERSRLRTRRGGGEAREGRQAS
jgi:hypothetical protein